MTEVLVVDDEPAILSVCELLLKGSGYSVTLAAGGSEAVTRLGQRRFDVALVDVNMPGMRGDDVLLWARRHTPAVAVVMMSTCGPEQQGRLLALGAAGFLPKPFRAQELQSAVEASLAGRRSPTNRAVGPATRT